MTSSNNKSLLYLHKYGRKAASYRHRFELFFEKVKEAGFELETQSLLDDEYLSTLYSSGKRSLSQIVLNYLNRFVFLLFQQPRHNLKVVYMELFPGLPYFLERLFLKPKTYILEMDDAYFLSAPHKAAKLIKNAKAVIVGSHYLKEFCLKHNNSVTLIPTVINLKKYNRSKPENSDITVGWMGSPSTAKELNKLSGVFSQLSQKYNIRFLFIGSGKSKVPTEAKIEYREWSEENEIKDIFDIDIGIMPLDDNEWNHGKCGFKLIQYMAASIPVVCSPVGENKVIVSDKESGFFAQSDEEWYSSIAQLAQSLELRQTMGEMAYQNIKQNYTLDAVFQLYIALLEDSL